MVFLTFVSLLCESMVSSNSDIFLDKLNNQQFAAEVGYVFVKSTANVMQWV